jgi:hypothetical protein
MRKYVTALLMVIPKEGLHDCLQQQQLQRAKCSAAQTDYTEGDPSHYAVCIQDM